METLSNKLKEFLHEKGFDTVQEIVIDRGLDSTGDLSLFVWLLLEDSVTDEDLGYEPVMALRDVARRQMREWEPDLYPYVRVRRVREWKEMVAL